MRRNTAEQTGVCRPFGPIAVPPQESSFDVVIDAVGGKISREPAIKTVRPGEVVMHIGPMDNDGGVDARKITLQEITFIGAYPYTAVDLRAAA